MSESKRKSNTPWMHAVKKTRREAAEARQAERNKRSDEEQLARLDYLDLTAERERARLTKRIAERAAKIVELPKKEEKLTAEKPKQEKKKFKKGK